MKVRVERYDGDASMIERLDKVLNDMVEDGIKLISVSHTIHAPDWYSVLVTYMTP